MEFYLWLALYIVIGVPTVGYIARLFVRLGKHMYKNYPPVRAFFDSYWENYGLGIGLTIVGVVILAVSRWMGWV